MRATHRAAFAAEGEEEAESVSALAVALLRDPTARPCVSLLAERDGAVLGSALFTAVCMDGDVTQSRAAILCPLAVVPDAQRGGVGTALIETGVRRLRDAGTALVFVLGDPRYYGRQGLLPVGPAGPQPPYAVEMAEAWQVRELEAGALARAEGVVRCADSLEDPAHW